MGWIWITWFPLKMEGTPIAGWFIMGNATKKWMMTGGTAMKTPIYGNPLIISGIQWDMSGIWMGYEWDLSSLGSSGNPHIPSGNLFQFAIEAMAHRNRKDFAIEAMAHRNRKDLLNLQMVELSSSQTASLPEGRTHHGHWIGLRESLNRKLWGFYTMKIMGRSCIFFA